MGKRKGRFLGTSMSKMGHEMMHKVAMQLHTIQEIV